jgi:hypothetical protein
MDKLNYKSKERQANTSELFISHKTVTGKGIKGEPSEPG